MNPQYESNNMETYPTSPWTEAYQNASASQEQTQQDDDAQQPTHDALSDIYNRGYSA
jgi:hypothetical protein